MLSSSPGATNNGTCTVRRCRGRRFTPRIFRTVTPLQADAVRILLFPGDVPEMAFTMSAKEMVHQ